MRVAVLGAGIAGLAASIVFARAGHLVILVERDPSPAPERPGDSFLGWDRPGVPQRRLVHGFVPLGRLALRADLPDIAEKLYAVGAHDVDLLDPMSDRNHQAGDEDLVILRCRRTVFEWVLRQSVLEEGVRLVSGEVAVSLTGKPGGAKRATRVTGVRLRSGGLLDADLVVDAAGRQSASGRWLAELGVQGMVELKHPCGVIYYTRFYERRQPGFPLGFRGQLGYGIVSASAADGRTFDITFFVRAEEPGLRRLRDADAFERAVDSIDGLAAWREAARPLGPVAVMGALENRIRRLVAGGRPSVIGFIPLGDSLSITNPTIGRGMSLAFHQAIAATRIDWSVPGLEDAASAYHAAVDPLAEASFNDAVEADRIATQVYAGDPEAARQPRTVIGRAISLAAAADHELYRAMVRHSGMLVLPGSLYVEPWISRARTLLSCSSAVSPGPDLAAMVKLLQG